MKEDGKIPLYALQFNLNLIIMFSYFKILPCIHMTSVSSVATHLCFFTHTPKKG